MVYTVLYIPVLFEWDENKNRANRAKHGIDFAFAREAFNDPFAITRQDRNVDGEQRYQLDWRSLYANYLGGLCRQGYSPRRGDSINLREKSNPWRKEAL